MPVINVKVENKIAQAEKGAYIVCGNSDYIINFELGEEWSGHNFKTALFVYNGKLQPVVFEGNSCAVPVLYNTTLVAVGLQSKDKTLITTTPSYIRCEISAEDLGGEIEAPAQDVYDEIIALLNKYITEGGGASGGGLTEEQVKEIVSEEIADLQTKTDESLETESKTVVGSINELNNKNNSISQDIAVVNAILEQSGIVSKYKATVEDTYSERVTADGANVLDGSKAKLEKVVGSTVACKQLFDKNSAIDGYEIINILDGTLGVNAEWFTTNYIPVRPNTTYVVSGKPNGSAVMAYNSNKVVIKDLTGGGNGRFTTTEDTAFVRLNGYLIQKDTFKIEEGSTATEYQPYFTGLKSASFGGIESGGKNLFNSDRVERDAGASSSSTIRNFVENSIYAGLARDNNYSKSTVKNFSYIQGKLSFVQTMGGYGVAFNLPCKPNTQYTVSAVVKNFGVFYQGYYTENGTYISNTTGATFTTPANAKNMIIGFSSQTFNEETTVENIQVEEGSTATEYTPYISPYLYAFPKTETPLGTTIDFENKKITDYGVDLVLTGTEKWTMRGQTFNDVSHFYSLLLDNNNYNFGEGVCTDFDKLSALTNKVGFAIGSMNAALYLSVDKTQITSVDDLKVWLAQRYADGNPVTIRYVSSTLQSEMNFTADNEYTAYKGGTETVLDNDGKEYGAENTLSQNYIIVTEVK